MQITVIPNGKSPDTAVLAVAVCQRLRQMGVTVVMERQEGGLPSAARIARSLAGSDLAVAVGGDGTIMHVAKAAALADRPVLGINGGHLGFLAGLERDGLDALPRLLTGDYTTERRLLLEITVERGKERQVYYAMNEAVISRGALSRLVDVTVSSGQQEVLACRGDGVIVATPTGSTAYSLSAGGPVVDPAVECLLVTPVCPHTVTPRAQILPAAAQLTVQVASGEAFVTVDGEENAAFSPEDRIGVRRAERPARLIRLTDVTFYQELQQKIIGRRIV